MHTSVNKANIGAIGPWIVVLLMGLDRKFAWGFEEAWYAALASLLIWVAAFAIPNAEPKPTNPNLQSHFLLACLLTVMVLLSGCTLLPYGPQVEAAIDQARETAVKDRKKFNDDQRDLTLELGCDISVGSVGRMEDLTRQFYLLKHCGVESAAPPPAAVDLPLTN
jgi:hypothetical protein